MPAAAVIPAPIAYIKVVAVKKLVVDFGAARLVRREASTGRPPFLSKAPTALHCSGRGVRDVYFEKIRVFKAGHRLNTLAWNNGKGPRSYFVGF